DKKNGGGTIALNKRARHDYFIEEQHEAGPALQGWEGKSLRAAPASITEAYVTLEGSQARLVRAQFTPLPPASTHHIAAPTRSCRSHCTGRKTASSSTSAWPRARNSTTSAPPRKNRTGNGRRNA